MKKIGFIATCCVAILMSSCNDDPNFPYSGEPRLYFGGEPRFMYDSKKYLGDTLLNHTFVFSSEEITEDTLRFYIYAMGGISDVDRSFTLEQVQVEEADNAVAGVHYLAFDSKEMKQHYVIKANQYYTYMPVVMLRHNDLETKTLTLRFQIKENENFKLGELMAIWREMRFTDRYQKANKWSDYYFGNYGDEKMKFMVRVSGKKLDNDFFNSIDAPTSTYWGLKFKEELLKENNAAIAAGGEKLKEADGTEVVFP